MYHLVHQLCYIVCYVLGYVTCYAQAGPLDQQDAEAATLFTSSERLIQEHVRKYKNGAAELKDLIQQVLHRQAPGIRLQFPLLMQTSYSKDFSWQQ